MGKVDLDYEQLPQMIRDNLSPEQWEMAQNEVILEHDTVPDTALYVNLKNGQQHEYQAGEPAHGPLLAVHNLAGGRGKNDSQFESAPRGAITQRDAA